MEFDIRPYNFSSATLAWLILAGVLAALGLGLSLVLSVARNGKGGIGIFSSGLVGYLNDIISISPRRILALTQLTLKEAVRRKALLVFVLFAILLMFAGWFIADANERPELQVSVHVTFLLTAISWLILPAVMFLSCWALPEDIRIRSLHTVVTKPARRLEIVIGRMAGLGVVTLFVLIVMGAIGLFWLTRRIPDSAKSALNCRVPVFGELYFISSEGQPQEVGLNVGDVWAYRSHILGNSRARAVWVFRGLDESCLTRNAKGEEELQLECRFEAFRTVKGSERSILQGISAQYTLASNPREEAFGMLAQSETVRPFADALRDGQYRNASDRLKQLTERMRTAPGELRPADYFGLHFGLLVSGSVLQYKKDSRLDGLAKLLLDSSTAGQAVSEAQRAVENGGNAEIPYAAFADSLDLIAETLVERSSDLMEALPRLEVPLSSFHVAEYHDGDEDSTNLTRVPRKLKFVADYETLGRFLSGTVDDWNGTGRLLDGNALKASLTDDFVKVAKISQLNAERLVAVLGEQLSGGSLVIEGGKLKVADNRSWFVFFDDLIRREALVSADTQGWMIERDLLNDVAKNGELRVEVACINDQMYLGMARPDLFIRKADQPFWAGYWKALINIALMLLLIIVLGVTVSCIVKGPVALFFTLTFFIVGQFFHDFMLRKLDGIEKGMGTVESAVLIAQHRNPEVGMDVSETAQNVVRAADKSLEGVLWVFSNIVPDFTIFNRASAFVENRFDVPLGDVVLPAVVVFIGFLIPCILIAGALLKFRELESK
jgi:ABC-type transport system involved in multi-copper enzyme maturation permease subunit